MPELHHIALMIEADRSLDRGVAYGVGDYLHDHPHWSLYVDKGDLKWSDFRSWHTSGVITSAGLLAGLPRQQLSHLKVPLVVFGGPEKGDKNNRWPSVMSDHTAIGEMAAEYLINQGLKHFAFCGPEEAGDLRKLGLFNLLFSFNITRLCRLFSFEFGSDFLFNDVQSDT